MSESQEQPIPAKSEISFPATEVNKTKVDKVLQKPKKGISKKQLAQRLIASAVIAANLGIPADHVSKSSPIEEPRGVTRELSLQDLEKRAETLYQINIISPEEMSEVDFVGERLKTVEWSKEDINKLTLSFDKLPPHFYFPAPQNYRIELPPSSNPFNWPKEFIESSNQQFYEQFLNDLKKQLGEDFFISREDFDKAREQGHFSHYLGIFPAEFALVDNTESQKSTKWIGECSCYNTTRPQVIFRSEFFKEKYEFYRLPVIAHELTHRVIKNEDQDFILELIEHPKDIPMEDFLKPNVKKLEGQIGALEEDRLDYGTTNTDEFIAVGGEFYMHGKERFLEVYNQFIGKEKAEKFYDYMRDDIFRGTEYKDYQKMIK